MNKSILLLISIVLISITSNGQKRQINPNNTRVGESVEYCVTHKKRSALEQNAAYLKIKAASQAIFKNREAEIIAENNSGNKQSGVVYTIPVVFHILHNNGDENISREQVLNAVEILNTDYRLQNNDANNVVSAFQGMPSDVEIEFVLATKAPNGACFGGITRTISALTDNGDDGGDQLSAAMNGNDVYNGTWSPTKYLNIIVANDIGGAAGYTFKPWGTTSMYYNSIFILHNYVSAIGTGTVSRSRALTHEVGHWLNLSHTWGGNNDPGDASSCGTDDGVSDTPNTIGVTSCLLGESSCGTLANVENYMDYSYCSKMYTQGQVNKMRAALTSPVNGRNSLWQTSNLNAVGANGNATACEAIFNESQTIICAGESIDFTDESYNNISGWNWTFTGGSPSSSTDANPSIIYDTPGTYSVTLQASDGSNTVSKTKTQYITVLSAPGNDMPIYESFETTSSLPNEDWYVGNPDNSHAWNVTSLAAKTGSKSLRLYNYGNQEGDIDEFISTSYDLSEMESVTVAFKYAYAKKSSTNQDKLQFLVSYNCGETWVIRKTISSSQLPTSDNTTSNFTPDELEWEEGLVTNLTSTYFVDNFRFKFVFTSGGGNNVYIDDINIWGVDTNGVDVGAPDDTGIEESYDLNTISLYPNPASENTTLSIELFEESNNVQIGLFDMVGKKLTTIHDGRLGTGIQDFKISTGNLSKGIYLVVISKEGRNLTKKLIIE